MVKAIYNDVVIAETEDYEVVEGNVYFPPESINREYFSESNLHTTCSWKGVASYYTVSANGSEASDVAWYYPEPMDAAGKIKDYVAFYPQVKIEK